MNQEKFMFFVDGPNCESAAVDMAVMSILPQLHSEKGALRIREIC